MRYKLTASLAFVLALAGAGCQTLKDLNLQNPNYVMRDIRPRVSLALPLSASTIDFDMMVEVQNPNSVGLSLDRIDFDLMVNDAAVVKGFTNDRVRVPARGNGEVRLQARVGYDQIRNAFRGIADAIQGNRARYELRGRAYYNTPVGRMDFPFTVYRASL